jgi:magnesium chelatase subunit I
VFAINELPDLAERIQVGLLNVLEERDVQIRGYKIRLPLDVVLVASANPEDYTNRGRIITPLKDRFGSQIRTHYPLDAELEYEIMQQEAQQLSVGETAGVAVPHYLGEVVATFSQLARASHHVNQRSGVSVRLSVSNYEALAANALRRGLRAGERHIVARVDDLDALAASSIGKIEIEALEDGREGVIFDNLVKGAVLTVFNDRVDPMHTTPIVDAFEEGLIVHTGEDMSSDDLSALVEQVDALREPVDALLDGDTSPAAIAAATEFILEGLHLNKRLNKDDSGTSATYRGR